MFIGHFAVALGAKGVAPSVSLGTLMLAAQFIDLLWPTFLATGLEQVRIDPGIANGPPLEFVHYPISHSLLAVIGWALLLALAHFALRRSQRSATVIAGAVLSHWLLDLLVHQPDLPIFPGGATLVGLGLWSLPIYAMVLELTIFAAGVWYYTRVTSAVDGVGRWAFRGLVAFLLAIQFANTFGSAPPDLAALIWVGQAQWLLVAWGYWVDRHRKASL